MTWTPDELPATRSAPDPSAADGAPSWAHASGWMQLSGAKQTLSCVLPCRNQAHVLSKLLPLLSDSLTECGYPWELIVVDRSSPDDTAELLDHWTRLPGFRRLDLAAGATMEDAVAAGLMSARADAVILFDPSVVHSPELIPNMVLMWEAGALLVHAQLDPASRQSVLQSWDETQTRLRIADPEFMLPAGCTQLGLLDRQFVDWMLGAT